MRGEKSDKPNIEELLRAFDGDKQIMNEIVTVFLTESPAQLEAIENAAEVGDYEVLRSALS